MFVFALLFLLLSLGDNGLIFCIQFKADRTVIETFVGGGLAVMTSPVLAPGANPANVGAVIYVLGGAGSQVTVKEASAWQMGCCWAEYP